MLDVIVVIDNNKTFLMHIRILYSNNDLVQQKDTSNVLM